MDSELVPNNKLTISTKSLNSLYYDWENAFINQDPSFFERCSWWQELVIGTDDPKQRYLQMELHDYDALSATELWDPFGDEQEYQLAVDIDTLVPTQTRRIFRIRTMRIEETDCLEVQLRSGSYIYHFIAGFNNKGKKGEALFFTQLTCYKEEELPDAESDVAILYLGDWYLYAREVFRMQTDEVGNIEGLNAQFAWEQQQSIQQASKFYAFINTF